MAASLPGGAEAEAEARNDTSEQHWASLMQSVDLPQVILAPFVGPLEHNSLI